MPDSAIAYALTTKARIKDRLSITESKFDTLLDRLIAAATDYIEGECGGKRFKETTYTNVEMTIHHPGQKYVALLHAPVGTVTAMQYRAGLKSSPNWTNFATDDWELAEDGKSGLVRVYGLLPGVNLVRASYTGGYKIDFSNFGSPTAHTLPADISDLCERMVVRLFRRREHEEKQSETFEGATVNWKDLIDTVDRGIIERHRRVPEFV